MKKGLLTTDFPTGREGSEAHFRQAVTSAAERLGVDPEALARQCAGGELADVIIELRLARFGLDEADQARVEELLRGMGVLP